MTRRICWIVGCAGVAVQAILLASAAAAGPTSSGSPPAAGSAQAFLHSIYDHYIGPADKNPPIDWTSARELHHDFSASLANIIEKDLVRAKKADDVPTIDGDPFINAQDWDIKSFDITSVPVDANHATGIVKFDNIDRPERFNVHLVRDAGAWKIDDIDYGGKEGTLRGVFKGGAVGK